MRDGSGVRDYRYVSEDMDRHGNVRLYFRRKGQPKIRLMSTPGTPAFEDEYQQANNNKSAAISVPRGRNAAFAAVGTMRWLVGRYYISAKYQELDAETRKVRRRILDGICEAELTALPEARRQAPQQVGELPYAGMEPRHVAKLRDDKAETPEAANSRVKALRQLFAWACQPEYRLASTNPARDVAYLKPKKPGGHRAWTDADVEKFEKRHKIGTKPRLMLDLLLYTGVRISDVGKLGPQMERPDSEWGAKLVFTETKGRGRSIKTHELPILPPLRTSIDAAPTGHLVYLATAFGRPYSVKGLGQWFARQCKMAGIDTGLSAHGLRKLAAVRCVEAGATEHQLMALFGWTTTKQAALYTRSANRAKLEAGAAPLLAGKAAIAEREMNGIVPLSGAMASGGAKRGKNS